MTLFLALVDRFGFLAGVVVLAFSGACEMAPYVLGKFGLLIPEAFAHGLGKVGGAVALAAFARNSSRSEAEKRLSNDNLGNTSVVPAIQKQIDNLKKENDNVVQPPGPRPPDVS